MTQRASNGFSWADHEPTKHVTTSAPMSVTCKCGWQSKRGKTWAMDQYRAHVTSLMPKHDEVTKVVKMKRLEHYGQTRGRRR